MVNSDDAILSLMNEMSAQQGYQLPISDSTNPREKQNGDADHNPFNIGEASSSRKPRRPLQIAELGDYPDNDRLVGSHSVWNPYIQPGKKDYLPSTGLIHSIATNPTVEVIRRRAFERFKQDATEILQRNQQSWKVKLPIPSLLEKWHMDAKLEEQEYQQSLRRKKGPVSTTSNTTYANLIASTPSIYQAVLADSTYWPDPILLSKRASVLFRAALEPEVKRAWAKVSPDSPHPLPAKFEKKSSQIQKGLYRCICQAHDVFQKQLQQAVQLEERSNSQQMNKRRKLPKVSWDVEKDQYQVTYTGISFRVHTAYYEKMQRLYDRATYQDDNGSFEEVLFCVLCRYDMLQGAGLQAGVPGKVMDTLLETLDCSMECFASPLNCRYEGFASAFDIDRAFGSLGSFFQLDFLNDGKGGCYQANPPFCERVIQSFNDRMHKILQKSSVAMAGESEVPLMFVVFVPVWKESQAYTEGLLANEFLTEHLVLPHSKHWYTEGTQHRRKSSFRVASFDTSILFYQNAAATKKWPITKVILGALEVAFCEAPSEMEKTTTTQKRPRKLSTTTSSSRKAEMTEAPSRQKVTLSRTTAVAKQPKAKKPKKEPGKRKAKIFESPQQESQAHLSILASLGLATKTSPEKIPKGGDSSKRSENGSKMRHKKKKRKRN